MIHAYDENMRPRAQETLGCAVDYAAHEIGYLPEDFLHAFVQSGLARRFALGDPSVVMGRSGIELALDVMERTVGIQRTFRFRYAEERSPEYWLGWALAYYQWETGLDFGEILAAVPPQEIAVLYPTYHEADITRFVDRMNLLYREARPQTALKRLRRQAGLTQEELAERAGVSVRTIQQYEQRRKDINKAQLETVMALAWAIGVEPGQLYERVAS